ncbi:MAG: Mannose-6-phosphate isomerase [Microbacteriaceae bacterium]|jgi:mannose-6-phosphate isomerase|nr:Mannose-6-phosphate isomerase [Microbacteriaceae bacterium]
MTNDRVAGPPEPLLLSANQPLDRPYKGGSGIARFRGMEHHDPYTPEDFVASTTEVFSGHGVGLSRLPDGRTLRDAVAADPLGYLGPEHVRRFGANSNLLVKLLSTDERLFVHYHPDAAFASSRLGRTVGKTEAWIIVNTDGQDDAYAYLGFNRPVSDDEVQTWVTNQQVEEMLTAMNRVTLHVGDTLFVPAGIAHSIGPGITLVELQEPTDLSILLEYDGFPGFTLSNALLGLDIPSAISGLQRSLLNADQLTALSAGRRDGRSTAQQLFPAEADPFFTAWRLDVEVHHTIARGFAVLVVTDGDARLEFDAGSLDLEPGATVLIPYDAGDVSIVGRMRGILCAPPALPKRG